MAKTRKQRQPWYRAASTWIAVAMVAAAGVLAWQGSGAVNRASGPSQTLAGAPARSVATVAAPGSLDLGGLPTRVVIPSAGIDTRIEEVGVMLDGARPVWETAWHAAGHHLDSALPGQPGNVVLTGHVSVADKRNVAVFATLDKVKAGDAIELYSGERVYTYTVQRVSVVDPGAVKVLKSSADSTVTLVTCTRDLKHRLVVVGTLA